MSASRRLRGSASAIAAAALLQIAVSGVAHAQAGAAPSGAAAGSAAASALPQHTRTPAGDLHRESLEASIVRGAVVYRTYCVLCHGVNGEGDGRGARLYTPPPADLVRSPHNDDYKRLIVQRGGQALGRSPFMPPWGDQLTDEQMNDLVRFLATIARR